MDLGTILYNGFGKVKDHLKGNARKYSLLFWLGLFSLFGQNSFGQSIGGQVFVNMSKTSVPRFKPDNVKMKLVSKESLGKKIKEDITIVFDKEKDGSFYHKFESLDDVVFNDGSLTRTRFYNRTHFNIVAGSENIDHIVKRYKPSITFDKGDFDHKRDIFQYIFLYEQRHWKKGNLWFSLTTRTKIDYSKKPILLVGGLHNENKEFGEMQEQLSNLGYQAFEFNYPFDQDNRLTAWLLKDGIDFVCKLFGKKKIDLVGHSNGCIVIRTYLQERGLFQQDFGSYVKDNVVIRYGDNVNSIVFLAPPNHGSYQSNRIVNEGFIGFMEECFPGRGFGKDYEKKAPIYKQLSLGNFFLWDLNHDFSDNFKKYKQIPMLIVVGYDDDLVPGLKIVLPETRNGQGDGFVSVCSTYLPGVQRVFVKRTHNTIKGCTDDILTLIGVFAELNSIPPKEVCDELGILNSEERFDGSIEFMIDNFDDLLLSVDNKASRDDFVFLEEPNRDLGLKNHTVNTNPDIYANVPVKPDRSSLNNIYFHFTRTHFVDHKQGDLVGLPPGKYHLLTFKTEENREGLKYKTWMNFGCFDISPGRFTMVGPLYNEPNEKYNEQGQIKKCMSNMRILEDCINLCRMDNSLDGIDDFTVSSESGFGKMLVGYRSSLPVCPDEGIYVYDVDSNSVSCSVHGNLEKPSSKVEVRDVRNGVRSKFADVDDDQKIIVTRKMLGQIWWKVFQHNAYEPRNARELSDLVPKYIQSVPVDLWGNFFYISDDRMVISSRGPDGLKNTGDDVCVTFKQWCDGEY